MRPALTAAEVRDAVVEALRTVPDPEIPVCSVLDLGLFEDTIIDGDRIEVRLLPTFSGCPALDVIRHDVHTAVTLALPGYQVEVRFVFDPPWTTDRISHVGRESMAALGIAPPSPRGGPVMIDLGAKPNAGPCPYCDSTDTKIENVFGPTPCRAIAYCPSCRNPFELFKDKR